MKLNSNGKSYPQFAQDKAITQQLFVNSNPRFLNGVIISPERLSQAKADSNKTTKYYLKIFIGQLHISKDDKTKIEKETANIVTKIVIDANNSAKKAKTKYHRVRPYYFYNKTSCTGDDSSSPKREISYPSGHSVRGITVARVLANILPTKYREQLLIRGMEYGDNRVICGAHWQSDIEASRVLSGFVIEHLQNNDDYNRDINIAKKQIGRIQPLPQKK